MKIPLVVAVIASAFSFAQPNFAQQKETADTQIVQLIVAHQKIYDEAFNNGDAAALTTKMFTEDAVLVTDSGPIYGRRPLRNILHFLRKMNFNPPLQSLSQIRRWDPSSLI
jgi:hypothetical protein